MGVMTVKCKHCGAENTKEADQYVVKCPNCGKETTYFIQPDRRR